MRITHSTAIPASGNIRRAF